MATKAISPLTTPLNIPPKAYLNHDSNSTTIATAAVKNNNLDDVYTCFARGMIPHIFDAE